MLLSSWLELKSRKAKRFQVTELILPLSERCQLLLGNLFVPSPFLTPEILEEFLRLQGKRGNHTQRVVYGGDETKDLSLCVYWFLRPEANNEPVGLNGPSDPKSTFYWKVTFGLQIFQGCGEFFWWDTT